MTLEISTLDFISGLPTSIMLKILTLMPIRDAFRTSILSRKWRYHCLNIPKLEFSDGILRSLVANCYSCNKYKMLLAIHTILLLHHAPVLEFSLSTYQMENRCEIDHSLLHLATNSTTLEKFTLCFYFCDHKLKLPSSFFSLEKLTHLKLQRCTLYPLSTLPTFSKLTNLYFDKVTITQDDLLLFLRCCPLITNFTLIQDHEHFTGIGDSDLVVLVDCLPSIEHLHMNCYPIEFLAPSVIPQKLTHLIVHLKVLVLSGLSFAKEAMLRSVLFLVTNSPNIQKIKLLEMYYHLSEGVSQTVMNLIDKQDFSYVSLDHLVELEITNLTGIKPEMDFVKLILARSPMLMKLRLIFSYTISGQKDELRILKELLDIPRASSRARITVE